MAVKVKIDADIPPEDIRAIANHFLGFECEVVINVANPTSEHLSRNETATPDEEC